MTEHRNRFETDVPGISGWWPTTPALWSYSSLKEMEACPRRWMLSRADYPDLWDQHGYPSLPVVAAIFGKVVHSVIERLTKALGDGGITLPAGVEVVGLLSGLGGWRRIVTESIEECLSGFEGSPRVSADRLDRVRDALIRRVPEAADQVKVFLGRNVFPIAKGSTTVGASEPKDGPMRPYSAGPGAHPECQVTADKLRLTGRIDLLRIDDQDVTVTDFKTGAEDEEHGGQVRLYALLWDLDRQANPYRRQATQLRIAYPSLERAVPAPDAVALRQLERATADRVEAADAFTKETPPPATPSQDICQFCQVKHLCDAYWKAIPPDVTEATTDEWFDFEGRVLRKNGSRSWYLETLGVPAAEVLVRTVETDSAFPIGQRVRLLDVRRSQDPDDEERLVVTMVGTSEWFAVTP